MLDYKIYTFLTLCKTMNYRITASILNMTQPAVTNHIQQLETHYKCKLFIYENRTLYKTKEAKILEDYARSADYNSAKLFQNLALEETPPVRIGATRTIGDYIAPNHIGNLLSSEEVNLTFIVDNTQNLLNSLQEGDLDFLLVEGFVNKKDFITYPYKEEYLVGICSKSHPFAGKEVDISDIFSHKIIIRERNSGTREAFHRIITTNSYDFDDFSGVVTSNSFKAITALVASGIGISFVYSSVANSQEDISTFTLKNFNFSHQFTCVHLKDTTPSSYIKYFLGDK